MRSLLTLVGAAVVTFAVVGWFLGWYKVQTATGPDGHRRVDIDFNGAKIQGDLKKGEQRILNAVQQAPGSAPTVPAAPGTPPPAPNAPQAGQQVQPVSGTVTIRPAAVPVTQGQGDTWTYGPQ